jgi:phenylalanyl-tRNA synthetase beta chain
VDTGWEKDLLPTRANRCIVPRPIRGDAKHPHRRAARECSKYNINRKLARRVFEIGRVYLRDPSIADGELSVAGVGQPVRVAALAYGPAFEEQWGVATRAVDFFDVKADLEMLLAPRQARFEAATHPALHPGRCARVLIDAKPAGWIGELHPAWLQKYELPAAAVLFEVDAEPLVAAGIPSYREVSRFPPVIGISRVANDPGAGATTPWGSCPAAVQDIRLFDVYRGKGIEQGLKSLAFRVVMQDTARTLTDDEADAAMAGFVGLLATRFGARLRA